MSENFAIAARRQAQNQTHAERSADRISAAMQEVEGAAPKEFKRKNIILVSSEVARYCHLKQTQTERLCEGMNSIW